MSLQDSENYHTMMEEAHSLGQMMVHWFHIFHTITAFHLTVASFAHVPVFVDTKIYPG